MHVLVKENRVMVNLAEMKNERKTVTHLPIYKGKQWRIITSKTCGIRTMLVEKNENHNQMYTSVQGSDSA